LWELPVGFVRTPEGQIEKSPDRQVQQAIAVVFSKFNQLGSERQTVLWFRQEQILLPQVQPGSQGQQIAWLPATTSRVHQMLRNPCYAGAFAYGRTGTQTRLVEGRAQRRAGRLAKPMGQWEVLIPEHHPGYLCWEQYLKNQRLIAKNRAPGAGESGGAAKPGPALLSGLLRCGCCGRKLQVRYSGRQAGFFHLPRLHSSWSVGRFESEPSERVGAPESLLHGAGSSVRRPLGGSGASAPRVPAAADAGSEYYPLIMFFG
jgi:hypothetical protein